MATPIPVNLISKLLDTHGATLQLYASRWTNAPEDCVQEAFVELSGQKQLPDNPVAWLYRVVRNRALNSQRAEKRRSHHEEEATRLKFQSTKLEKEPFAATEQHDLVNVLGKLDPAEHELIVLRIWSGLTWSEIAHLIKKPSSTAQRQYVAAVKRLKKLLEEKCLTNMNSQKS